MLPHFKSSCGRRGASTAVAEAEEQKAAKSNSQHQPHDGNSVMLKLRHMMFLVSAATSSSNFRWLERAMAAV